MKIIMNLHKQVIKMITKHEYPNCDWFEVICDNCKESLQDIEENDLFPTETDAQNNANKYGWETLTDGIHYCEDCQIDDEDE